MKKILITGINGFVGRNIGKYLYECGEYKIIGSSTGPECKNSNSHEYIQAILGSDSFFDKFSDCKEIDIIVHVAAKVNHKNDDFDLAKANCLGCMQIGELAKQKNTKQIIYISSIPIIGKPIDIPITENHPINPLTTYHASKFFGETFFNLLNSESLRTISLRLPSPIGSDMPSNKIFSVFVDKCMKNENITLVGKGKRIQNYIDVDDISKAILLCLNKAEIKGIYNIAASKSYSNIELAQICIQTLNSKSQIEFNGKPDPEEANKWVIDTSKAERDLGFVATKNICETIKDRKLYCENLSNQ